MDDIFATIDLMLPRGAVELPLTVRFLIEDEAISSPHPPNIAGAFPELVRANG